MPNTRENRSYLIDPREKLFGLIVNAYQSDKTRENTLAQLKHIADHLIANGVTFQNRDIHWATEQAYKNSYTKGFEDGKKAVANQVASSSKQLASKWIPVTERLPDADGNYLVAKKIFNNSIFQEVLRFAKDGRKVDKYDFHREWKNVWYKYDSERGYLTIDGVTHWMPLPEPPKGE